MLITPDDFSLSLCKIPDSERHFWLFHLHSYLTYRKDVVFGKPIFLQAVENRRHFLHPIRKIGGAFYFNMTQQVIKGQLLPLPDSKICKSFSTLTGAELHKHGNPFFMALLMVPQKFVRRTIFPDQALSQALGKHCSWAEAFHALCAVLKIPPNYCGLTGSRAIEAHTENSDVDITFKLSPNRTGEFINKLSRLHVNAGGLFPDKYGLFWPLRIRIKGYEICLFPTYKTISQSCLSNMKIIRKGEPTVIKGRIFDTTHNLYSPTVLGVKSEAGNDYCVIFPSTEARGVFDIGDYFKAKAFPCIAKNETKYKIKHVDTFIVIDGLNKCPSLKRKLITSDNKVFTAPFHFA